MTDGVGGWSSNEIESRTKKRRRKNDEFAHAIARIAVAQVCESVGFQGFQQSALDALSDVVCKYIREIGKASSLYANLAGRTECNVFDIVQGLEDLNLSQGFVGASDRDSCYLRSGIIKEISQYVNLTEEIGFAYSVSSFPVTKEQKSTPSFLESGEAPPTEVIPPWLPKYPDPQTYTSIHSATTEETQTQIQFDKIDQELKVVLEPPSSKLKQFQSHNGFVFPVILEQGDISGRGRLDNPFLVVPLQPGEKEISVISLPAKHREEDIFQNYSNHVSELDTFTPESQVVKSGGNESEEGSRKVVLNIRPAVEVKFHIGKKSLNTAKVASWFLNDEEERRKDKVFREPVLDIEDHRGYNSVVN